MPVPVCVRQTQYWHYSYESTDLNVFVICCRCCRRRSERTSWNFRTIWQLERRILSRIGWMKGESRRRVDRKEKKTDIRTLRTFSQTLIHFPCSLLASSADDDDDDAFEKRTLAPATLSFHTYYTHTTFIAREKKKQKRKNDLLCNPAAP